MIKSQFEKAKAASHSWKNTSLEQRKKIIKRFGDVLVENAEELARLLSKEMGKPIKQARAEVVSTQERIQYFISVIDEAIATQNCTPQGAKVREYLEREALGVVANISAWNYPYFVSTNVFIPALLAGNTVLFKSSEITPQTGVKMEELLLKAGLPESVFIHVQGAGEAGRQLLECDVDGVFFTGSYQTGLAIAKQVASRMIPVQLELGGKDPTYVCEDVNIQTAAASLADGAFYNTGQSCCSVERLYVHQDCYARFVEAFLSEVDRFKMGDALSEDTYIGPLAREEQLSVLAKQVQDAVEKGAKLVRGGKAKGRFFEPTVLLEVDHSMLVMQEESFGPIIGIQKVGSDEEAIQLMNDTSYGLTAGVYTLSESRAKQILSQINSGTVYWNCCDRVSPRLPWSGRKHSGMGYTLSMMGLQAFTKPKAWHLAA